MYMDVQVSVKAWMPREPTQVLRKALPFLLASARQQDGRVHTESRVSPGQKIIGHILVDEPAHLGEELSVMPEEHSQGVWAG